MYDGIHHMMPICFAQSFETESEETWADISKVVRDIPGFDVDATVSNVNQEKSNDSAYRAVVA